ncbi:AAA ATPase central domain-containing protein (plasmid) [Scytonema sp. HK-05]|uniref:ATP-binding protein n=1 Tax=Scytonema sp. HK-05 TaxID=1137095 RepID=UPI000937D319|nr:ATP-binding protein [Scytonema sp. HK-05]OKH54445.1 ATPase [Scytonema sp. HK-05]BAY50008.1 AAA ATPase central domain-containing protein [Scytonema sp. HK-05]
MNRTPITPRSQAKIHYLHLDKALLEIEQAVEDYSDRLEQSTESTPDIESALADVATTMNHFSAIGHLCSAFHLSLFESQILLLCVAQATLPYFPQLCIKAQGNEQLAYPTFGLAMRLFPNAHWNAVLPESPLQYWQLVKVGINSDLPQSRLQIDNSILLYLLGEPYQDDRLMHLIQPMPVKANLNIPLQPSHQELAERLASVWRQTHTTSLTLPIVQLCGVEVTDKWAIAATACALDRRSLKVMSVSNLPTDLTELNHIVRRWEREATLTNSALLLDCEQLNLAEPALNTAILQLIQNTRTPLIISSKDRILSPHRPLMTFDVPKLTPDEQRNVWYSCLGSTAIKLSGHIEALVSQFNLNSLAIESACLQIKNQNEDSLLLPSSSLLPTLDSPLSHQLWDICRTMARPRLDDLAQRLDSKATWDDLILPEIQKNILRDLVTQVQQRAKVYWDWGFAGKANRGFGISALFAGASGTGKTMAAEVLAKELRLDLYRIDLSAVVSKYIGETEKNLGRIFDAAEAGGAILLFDEADALFGKRSEVKDSHDRHANVEVGYLLQQMEAYQGLAILTTNLKSSLDQAFLRRLRFVFSFPFPDSKSRAEIWRRVFPQKTPTQGLNFEKLAQLNLAGGNIRNIALNAAFIAAQAEEPVMMKHILSAAYSECMKLERALTDTEIQGWL